MKKIAWLAVFAVVIPTMGLALDEATLGADKLMTAMRGGDIHKVEAALDSVALDSWSLGRAMIAGLEGIRSDRERDAYRLATLFLSKGADPNSTRFHGKTALMTASEKRFETVATLLIDAGAVLSTKDDGGQTAWDYANIPGGDNSTIVWILDRAERQWRVAQNAKAVKNLKATVEGGKVVVYYDLDSSKPLPIRLMASGDNGKSFELAVKHVSGDVGDRVTPGASRKIVWAVKDDYPKGLGGMEGLTLDVVVSQR